MSGKKRGRKKQQQGRQQARERRTRGAFRLTPSLVFVGLIVLFVVIAAVVATFSGGERPSCPPGQVWSDAHNHCH